MSLNSDEHSSPDQAETANAQTKTRDKNLDILLGRVRQFAVEGVLEKSLYNEVLIELDKVGRPDAVAYPWESTFELPDRLPEHIPADTNIAALFEQAGRSLLILGDPGAGKTITMLELARTLIEKAEQDPGEPVPVVFNLSSWASQQTPLLEWLIYEFKLKYNIPRRFCQPWIEEKQLVLLLDGLDEVDDAYREQCLRHINDFLDARGTAGLVLCSRSEEYIQLVEQARLRGAIHIQPLRHEHINAYLEQGGDELRALRTMLENDPELASLAASPLMLNVMSLAYLGVDENDLGHHTLGSADSLRAQIFDRYIQVMVDRKGGRDKPYTVDEIKKRLGWLAAKMRQHGKTVFHLEELQASWLGSWFGRFSYAVTSRVLGGLAVGLFWSVIGVIVASIFLADFEANNPEYRTSWQAYYESFLDVQRSVMPGLEEAIQENPDMTVAKFPPMDLSSINTFVFFTFLLGALFAGFVIGGIDGIESELAGYMHTFKQQRTALYVVAYLCVVALTSSVIAGTGVSLLPYLFSMPALGGIQLFIWEGASVIPRFDYIAYLYLGIAAMMVFLGYTTVYGIFWVMRSIRADPGGDIKVVEKLNWSKNGIKTAGIKGLRVGFVASLIMYVLGAVYMAVMLFIGSRLDPIDDPFPGPSGVFGIIFMFFVFAVIGAIATALLVGANTAIFGGLRSVIVEGKSKPNQGIKMSARNAWIGSLRVWLVASLSTGILFGVISMVVALFSGSAEGAQVYGNVLASAAGGFLGAVLLFGVFLFPFSVLWFGGQDVIQHYVLRGILRVQGKTPSRFINFLDYAANVILLQKVGGGYIFIHRMVLEHFADAYECPHALA